MPDRASEGRTAERFARWLSQTTGTEYTVSHGDDPPDFLLHPTGWLEVSDIYLKEEQAKFLNVPPEKSFRFSGSGPLDETALRLVDKLNEKLSKQSYAPVYADRGKGILLLTCQDLLFDAVNLAQVHQTLASFRALNDRGFFLKKFILSINSAERIASMKLFTRERPNQSMKATAPLRVTIFDASH